MRWRATLVVTDSEGRRGWRSPKLPRRDFHDLVPEDAVLDRISHGHVLTEGPVWNAREGALYFVDILDDTIWKWTPGIGKSIVLRPSGKANGMTYDSEGRLLVELRLIVHPKGRPGPSGTWPP